MPQAMAAAVRPMASVSNPDRHQACVDHWLLAEPIPKKTTPVRTMAVSKA